MSAATVHQALHGYRRGHELLASSIRLPSSASDLVTRLSDLSGSIASGWGFTSYVTGYPVVGTPYFAIARTWEDKKAARAGCVLTHTLLIPIDAWRTSLDPRAFSRLFADESDLRDEERFKKPLCVEPASSASLSSVPSLLGTTVDFVRKYFGEGQRPLIWIDCPVPEDTAWAIVRVLWPTLREKFAWCTASLQPRSVDTTPLDLQFVPAAAYSRFHNIHREHFVGSESPGRPAEPWCLTCAKWIFSGSQSGPIDAELRAFGPYLRDDPTLMRHLFLAKDLWDRVDSSPTAGVGLLDVTEALAPSSNEAVVYKSRVAQRAMDAATAVSPDDALSCLFLVGERLSIESFQEIGDNFRNELADKVEKLVSSHARESLVMPERIATRADVTSTPYFTGVVRGLTRCAKESPTELICLQEFNKTAPLLFAASPSIAGGFLRGLRITKEPNNGRGALAGWIAGLSAHVTMLVRREVLPEVRDDEDVVVLDQLCRHLPSDEVEVTLSAIAIATGEFKPKKLLALLQDQVASRHPYKVRRWAGQRERWSRGVTLLVGATFSPDATGLSEVTAFGPDLGDRGAELLTVFLDTCTSPRVPAWLKNTASQSIDWMIPLLSLGEEMPAATAKILDRVVPELREVPLAAHVSLRPLFTRLAQFAFWPALIDLTLNDAMTGFVEGKLSEHDCRAWFSERWADNWTANVTRGDLASVLIYPVDNLNRRERAFRWLAIAPTPLYQRSATFVPSLFWELVAERRYGWTEAMGIAWGESIRRVRHSTPGHETLRLCADVLQFGFDHTEDAVGAAVAAAFYSVYHAVYESKSTPHEVARLFSLFDWDKAKELRNRLVSAFVSSNWNPGDLALSAMEDDELLRKLVKRTLRTENGYAYVSRVLTDLLQRVDPNAARTAHTVRTLLSDPDFYEPWD